MMKTNNIVYFQSMHEAYMYVRQNQKSHIQLSQVQVKEKLLERGLSLEECDAVMDIVDREKRAKHYIVGGILFLVVGLLVTVFLFLFRFCLAMIVGGFITLIIGLIGIIKVKKQKQILMSTDLKRQNGF